MRNKEVGRRYYQKNKEKMNEYSAAWSKANPEKTKLTNRRAMLKKKYSMTIEDYDLMLSKQNGTCKICKSRENGAYCVDHDRSCCPGIRSCGKCIRGLLCNKCNVGLGSFQDNPVWLDEAAKYIRSYNGY